MIKTQNFKHFKLPISFNPLEYGKLILKVIEQNLFIIQINKTNVTVINSYENINHIKLFKEGNFQFEYKDIKINDSTFVRHLENRKFTFKNNVLVSIEKPTNRIIWFIFLIFLFNLLDISNVNADMSIIGIAIVGLSDMKNKIQKSINNSYIYKHKFPELFITFEIFMVVLVLFLCIYFDENIDANKTLAAFSTYNIIKLRRVPSKHVWKEFIFKINKNKKKKWNYKICL
jgi:hypothetical protein